MMMKPSEILARSQEILLERGWVKNYNVALYGPEVCAGGALSLAAGGRVVFREAEQFSPWPIPAGNYLVDPDENRDELLRAYCFLQLITGLVMVSLWNDKPERTIGEVLDVLHQAELLAKESGE